MSFHRARGCHCNGAPCVCAKWEDKLRRDGLAHLEYEDSHGNVLLGNRGSGKFARTESAQYFRQNASQDLFNHAAITAHGRDVAAVVALVDGRAAAAAAATASLAKRLVILQHARFGAIPPGGRRRANRRRDRPIWELYAAGAGTKRIAADLKMPRALVRRRIAEIWRVHGHLVAPPGLAALVRECEPGTLALFFGLLRRAIDEPAEVEEMLRAAEAVPELRALMEAP